MGRLTLRLPDSLHDRLRELAEREGTSLNQYIVYALTRQTTLDYTLQKLPPENLAEQRAQFHALFETLGEASKEQIEQALANRDPADAESRLPPEVEERLRQLRDRSSQ